MKDFNFLFSNSVQGESDLTRYCPRDAFEMPLTCPRHLFCKMLILSMLLFLGIGNMWGTATAKLIWNSGTNAGSNYYFEATSGSITDVLSFSCTKNSSSTSPAYNSSDHQLRLYYNSNKADGNGNYITITAASGVTFTGFTINSTTAPTTKYSVNGGALTNITLTANTDASVSGLSCNSIRIQNCNTTSTQLRIKYIIVTYTTPDPCTITWHVNGSTTTAGSPTTSSTTGNKVTALPTAPTSAACDGSKVFVGWTETPIVGTTNTKPSDLFTTAAGAPTLTQAATHYYAVFADEEEEVSSKSYSFTISYSDFNQTSYAANDGSHSSTATATDASGAEMSVNWSSSNVMRGTGTNSSKIQFRNTPGYIYNTTDLNSITDVSVSGGSNVVTYQNSTSNPTSNGTPKKYFRVGRSSGTGYASSITVTFAKTTTVITYSNYATSCYTPLGTINGSISLSKGKRTDSPKQNQTQDNSYVWQKIG